MDRTSTEQPDQGWPLEEGLGRLSEFYGLRVLTIRAFEDALKRFHQRYFQGNERVLEIGSGVGFLKEHWPQFEGSWVSLDAQPGFLADARDRVKRGNYVGGSVYSLPFRDASFDAVGACGVFDVFRDLETACREAYRVLRPGGLFFSITDLGVDYEAVAEDFKKQRIPLRTYRITNTPSFFGSPDKKMNHDYIPEERLDHFLHAVGMTREEMDACPRIDASFGLDAFTRKQGFSDPKSCFEHFGELVHDYMGLFEQYAVPLDADAYFTEKLRKTLACSFGEDNVRVEKLLGYYRGKRTPQQEQHESRAFVYENNGSLVNLSGCYLPWIIEYELSMLTRQRFPNFARMIEPPVHEVVNLDVVVAQKHQV